MNDSAQLLNQLRIDRSVIPPRRFGVGLMVVIGLLLLAVVVLVWWWLQPTRQSVRIAIATAIAGGNEPASSILDASGYVVARRQATVASKVTGKLMELDIEEGDHVKAGQIIAKLDDSNARAFLNQSSAQVGYVKSALAQTNVNLANAVRDYNRQKSLLEGHFVSQAAVDNSHTTVEALRAELATQKSNVLVAQSALQSSARNLDDTIIRAPFAGVVTVKAAQPGEIVSPGSAGGGFTRTGIGTIVDMDSLEVQVDVNENFINRVQALQGATAKLNAYPEWQIPAHVIAVIPTADRSKGTVTVRIALDQKDSRILPEMGVRVAFLSDADTHATKSGANSGDARASAGVRLPPGTVQRTAGAGTGETGTVFVVHDETLERRAVRLGSTTNEGVTVLSGLTAGERVAAGDLSRMKDGEKIRIQP